MADILHAVKIEASAEDVMQAIITPEILCQWLTKFASGSVVPGNLLELHLSHQTCKAIVISRTPTLLELKLVKALPAWMGTILRFETIIQGPVQTMLNFSHLAWVSTDEAFREASYRWALDLHNLKRFLETGETTKFQ